MKLNSVVILFLLTFNVAGISLNKVNTKGVYLGGVGGIGLTVAGEQKAEYDTLNVFGARGGFDVRYHILNRFGIQGGFVGYKSRVAYKPEIGYHNTQNWHLFSEKIWRWGIAILPYCAETDGNVQMVSLFGGMCYDIMESGDYFYIVDYDESLTTLEGFGMYAGIRTEYVTKQHFAFGGQILYEHVSPKFDDLDPFPFTGGRVTMEFIISFHQSVGK